jgi:hypothetical protein
MSEVTNLSAHKNKDTIAALRSLLDRAIAGELHGILFCVKRNGGDYAMGKTGEYDRDPLLALDAASRLQHCLHIAVDASAAAARLPLTPTESCSQFIF